MPSDIYVKKDTGWSTPVTKIFARTNTGWSSAIRYVYAKINAGWTRVWPLSGVYPNTNPFISNNTTTTSEINYGTVLRVGTTYKGDRGSWNPNGFTISSYDYKWIGFASETGASINYEQAYQSLTTQTNTFTITGTTGANFDKSWITFRVRANASNSAYSGTADSLRYYVVRQKPRIATGGTPSFNITNPKVGDVISYSSSWDISDAYKPEASRSTIKWYKNTVNSTTGGTLVQDSTSSPAPASPYSYTVQASDSNNYIYAVETVYNSGSDYDLGPTVGVTASVITTSVVSVAPGAFTYSLTNISSVTTPSSPTQQRVSPTSNSVLVEMGSSFPADTESYELWSYGSGSAAGGTVANPATQTVSTLNQYDSNGSISASGSWDTVTNISTSASNSPISLYTKATGTSRVLQFNVSSTTGAQSWAINFTISGASAGNGTYTLNTNSMPRTTTITGTGNPTVTINSIKAYANLDQLGGETSGTAGFQTSLASVTKPIAFSGTSTSNYTYYTNYQATGAQRRVSLPSAFTSGTNIYVSTNGYINWGGLDPAGSTSIPTSGITIAPLAGDLRQGSTTSSSNTSPGGLWYFADSTNYYVTWWGNYYTDANQYARYQVKFYWGQSYADIYIVNNSLTTIVPSTTAVQNGLNEYQNWSGTSSQASTLLSTATMNRVSTNDGVDDDRTPLTASQPVAPTGGSAYMGDSNGSSISSINNGGTIYLYKTDASGNPTPTASWVWQRNDGAGGVYVTRQTGGSTYLTGAADAGFKIQLVVTWSNGVSPNQVYTAPTTVSVSQQQFTVTWNATTNGGTGGGTTTQNSGIAHTAPAASKTAYAVSYTSTGQTSGSAPSATQSYFSNIGYYDYPTTNPNQTGPIAVGGSFTPVSNTTMYMRYSTASQSVTLSSQGTLLRTGYTFGGWNIGGTIYSAGASYTPTANVTATAVWNQNAVAPSGGTVSISTNTGNYSVGSIITYSTSGWSGFPTSYYLELHNGTNPVLTSDPLRASTTSTSGTYTIQSVDVPNYFKAWATATNSAGSATAFSSQVGPATSSAVAPTISSASISPNSGTAGSTTFTASATVSGSPTPTVTYQWQYMNPSFSFVNVSGATSASYAPPANFNTIYPNFGFYCLITATNSAGSATNRPAATLNSPATGVAPSTPGTPTLTYVSSNNTTTDYGYSATWTNSSTGTAPISYYLKCYGSSDSYASVQATKGPFTTGSTAQSFTLPKTSGLWKVACYATNSYGTSTDSGVSSAQ